MKNTTKFIGLDVSKDKIAVGIADIGREAARYWGAIPHTYDAVKKLMERLGETDEIEVCYEAGPTGYELHRWLTALDIPCTVIAPSLIPQRQGDRVKTDRRDALRLAELFRAGELTSIYVPSPEDEALRDLVRAREDVKEDVNRSKQRLIKFLLRRQIHSPLRNWTVKHREWLHALTFTGSDRIVFQEYLQTVWEQEQRIERLEKEITRIAVDSHYTPLVYALQALRGVKTVTAMTTVAEIGSFERFAHPRQLMAYAGLVPSERSTGKTRRQGGITKAGNAHFRRVLVESAWSYRYRPAVKGDLLKRSKGQMATVLGISWKAQNRLHDKYLRMLMKGKNKGTITAAVARELVGFIWAIAKEVEKEKYCREAQ